MQEKILHKTQHAKPKAPMQQMHRRFCFGAEGVAFVENLKVKIKLCLSAQPARLRCSKIGLDACAMQHYKRETQRGRCSRFVALLGRFLP
jgi:hypothetical protein